MKSGDPIAIVCFPSSIDVRLHEQRSLIFFIYPYLMFISSIFLIVTFIVYAIIPEIRNVHGICIMCHVAALTVMYIGLGLIRMKANALGLSAISHRWCTALGM